MPVPVTLKIYKGSVFVGTKEFQRDIIKIGRLSSAHLSLEDEKISRIHSVIEVSPDGTLSIITVEDADRFSVKQNAMTRRSARTMALNPKNHDVYLVSAEFDEAPLASGQSRPRRTMRPDTFTLEVLP